MEYRRLGKSDIKVRGIYGMSEYIAKFSSAVSAIKCTRLGGRAGIPDLCTVEIF